MAPEEIHEFWLAGALTDPAKAVKRMDFWFKSTPATDELIAQRFGPALADAGRGSLRSWEAEPHSCLALVIVLDQFPRNVHRGTPSAFQHDSAALAVARRGIAAGYLRELKTLEQAFFLMPFQHCEDVACQREGVALFDTMVREAPAEWRKIAEGMLDYARIHLEIIERFGRFPHRNRILGRASTSAEQEYLASNTQSFGQA